LPADEDEDKDEGKKKEKKENLKLDAVGLAIGAQMIKSAKTKRDLIDASWNRFSFFETEGLPEWFVRDEKRHCRKPIPVDKVLPTSLFFSVSATFLPGELLGSCDF
jgi:AdoMet-dependent rRNA methyltransferase SPB1